jgi:tetratricopeptide (TPR) repeat protein
LMFQSKKYSDAVAYLRQLMAMNVKKFGKDNVACASVAVRLGDALLAEGNNNEASDAYEHALKIWVPVLSEDDARLFRVRLSLGKTRKNVDNTAAAREALTKASEIPTDSSPDALMTRLDALNHLGALLLSSRRYPEAEIALTKRLEVQKLLSQAPIDMTGTMYEIALTQYMQKKTQTALAGFKNVVAIEQQADKPDAFLGNALEMLGTMYSHQLHNGKEAELAYRQCIIARENLLGKNDLQVARALQPLALLVSNSGRKREAAQLLERCFAIQSKNAGVNTNVALLRSTLNQLKSVYTELGDRPLILDTDRRIRRIYRPGSDK